MRGPSAWRHEVRIPSPARGDLAAALGLLALALVLFKDAVFLGRALYERDIQLVWLPQVEAFVRALRSGAWPVWDESLSFGQPLLADPSAQVLYPPTWLHLLLFPVTYYTLFALGHVVFSALGLYLLAKRLGLSRGGAFVGAALWTASGPLLSLVNVYHLAGAAWMPWVILAAHRVWEAPRAHRVLPWAAAQALQILAGSADMVAVTSLAVLADLLRHLHWRAPGEAENRRRIAAALLGAALALGLTAAQWLPTLEIARRSIRFRLPEEVRTFWSVHPLEMSGTLFPVWWSDLPLRPDLRAAVYESREPFLHSLYLGMPALGLVGAAFAGPRRRGRSYLALLGALAALVALGRHGGFYAIAVKLLPSLAILRYPSKVLVLAALAWSLLAGMGLEAWRGPSEGRRRRWLLVALPLAACAALGWTGALLAARRAEAVGARLLVGAPDGASFREMLAPAARQLGLSSALASVVLSLAVARRWRGRFPAATGAVAAALAVLDLLATHQKLNPTGPRELLEGRLAIVDLLRRDGAERLYVYEYALIKGKSERYLGRERPYFAARVPKGWSVTLAESASLQSYLFPPVGGRWGLHGSYDIDLRGLYPVPLWDLTYLIRDVEGTRAHTKLLRMGGVTHVIALHDNGFEDLAPLATLPSLFPEPIRVFRVPGALPRAYAVGRARVADGPRALRILIDPAFDPEREVILAEGEARVVEAAFRGTSRIRERRPDRLLLEVELSDAGYVVVLDAHDPGWRVSVDGAPAPLLRANVAFRAVAVPAGWHTVEMIYRPGGLVAGLALSGVTLLAVVGWVAVRRRSSRRVEQATR